MQKKLILLSLRDASNLFLIRFFFHYSFDLRLLLLKFTLLTIFVEFILNCAFTLQIHCPTWYHRAEKTLWSGFFHRVSFRWGAINIFWIGIQVLLWTIASSLTGQLFRLWVCKSRVDFLWSIFLQCFLFYHFATFLRNLRNMCCLPHFSQSGCFQFLISFCLMNNLVFHKFIKFTRAFSVSQLLFFLIFKFPLLA